MSKINFSKLNFLRYIKKWGQTHEEICNNLDYDPDTSNDLLMVYYFWHELTNQWYPKCSSLYTDEEQRIADYLRNEE